MRIAIVGPDNTHADHAVRHFNAEQALGDARVTALCGGDAERAERLGIAWTAARPEELIGHIDAAIVMDRDGALHRRHAEPLLKAGIPVLVDKPLATTVADAEAILAAASAGGAAVTSFSALRWTVDGLRPRLAGLGEPRAVTATGPVQRTSPYGGVGFYGIHPVEMALHLLPVPSAEPVVSVLPGAVLVTLTAGDAHAVVNLVERDAATAVPFHLAVVGTSGVFAEVVTPAKDYTLPALRHFAEMVRTGVPPLGEEELLAPVRVLEAVTRAVG
ncbi:Gfo/Idh/MocA family oxidoreductase [Nonomuraea longicatena]|uniref:Gfo/Idh/MocA-like oxidoreductase N-terminal domain-containing protein n=1 Tax=Nonomuraea longicatena TaxID=83682 RepID=A0ABN1P9M8_9ACTN